MLTNHQSEIENQNNSPMNIDNDEATVPKYLHEDKEEMIELPLLSSDVKLKREKSFSSSSSNQSDYRDICRICHCEGTNDEPLISPCLCLGTMKYLHQSCLQRWIKSSGVKSCELCKFDFIMHSEVKPFKQWQKLDMNIVERRKVMCSVAFNLIAVICVLWSLHVLIEKTREEIREGKLQWQFWTKLIVVAIGFTGGLVFLYVQCKMYFQLCVRWRQFNQRIIIHSINEQDENGNAFTPIKTTNNFEKGNNCIITVLDANDLVPMDSDNSSTINENRNEGNQSRSFLSNQIGTNSNQTNRNLFQRLFNCRRSFQSSR